MNDRSTTTLNVELFTDQLQLLAEIAQNTGDRMDTVLRAVLDAADLKSLVPRKPGYHPRVRELPRLNRQDLAEAMRIEEAAAFLGASEWIVRRMIAAGDIPALRLHKGRIVIPRDAFLAWFDGQVKWKAAS